MHLSLRNQTVSSGLHGPKECALLTWIRLYVFPAVRFCGSVRERKRAALALRDG